MSAPLVVGYDDSECSRAALAEALRMSEELDAPVIAVFGYAPSRTGGEVADFAAALRELAENVLGHAVHQAEAAGRQIEIEVVDDRPAEALVRAAAQHEARLIVVGEYGQSPIKGAILGSTAYRLLGLSDRPVLVVPV